MKYGGVTMLYGSAGEKARVRLRRLSPYGAALVVLGLMLAQVVPIHASETIAEPLTAGNTLHLERTVQTPAIPVKPDVVFLADTTGSMGGAIGDVQGRASSVMTRILAVQTDAAFGVAEYKDFLCDEPNAFRIDQSITTDTARAQTGIGKWEADGGCDGPEAQLNALYELATSPDIKWRDGASHIIAWFGDAPGHDPSNGHTLSQTISALTSAKIRVVAVDLGWLDEAYADVGKPHQQATAITDATSGTYIYLGYSGEYRATTTWRANTGQAAKARTLIRSSEGDSVAEAILAGLKALPVTIAPQTAECSKYVHVTFDPTSATVMPGEKSTFQIRARVDDAPPDGTDLACKIVWTLNGVPVDDPALIQTILLHGSVGVPGPTATPVPVEQYGTMWEPTPGPPEMFYPHFNNSIRKAGQPSMIDLGSFECYHSEKTSWWIVADWGDDTPALRFRVDHDGGIGAFPHTYAKAGKYTVTVSIMDDWSNVSQHDFVLRVYN